MNAVTFALCQKPGLGIALWLASLCVTNQALHDAYIDLGQEGSSVQQNVNIPMDESYTLSIWLKNEPQKKDAPISEKQRNWNEIICATESGDVPTASNGRKFTLSLKTTLTTAQGAQVSEKLFSPECPRPSNEDGRVIHLDFMDIKKGNYSLSITNGKPIPVPNSQRAMLLLHGRNAGFP